MAGEKYAARRGYWADIIHQCNQSGMIKNEWLRQHDISSKSFGSIPIPVDITNCS